MQTNPARWIRGLTHPGKLGGAASAVSVGQRKSPGAARTSCGEPHVCPKSPDLITTRRATSWPTMPKAKEATKWEDVPDEIKNTTNPIIRQFITGSAVGPIKVEGVTA